VIIRSLLSSRKRWKAKSLERLEKFKALQRKAARLKDSRQQWRKKARQAEHEVRELRAQGERPPLPTGEAWDEAASATVAAAQKKPPASS
jgi:hypothetical protein